MSELRERYPAEWTPDADFFKAAVAIALVFKAVRAAVTKAKLQSAIGQQLTAYIVAKLSFDHGQTFDPDFVWETQEVSSALVASLEAWVLPIHTEILTTAGQRNIGEWCRKDACSEGVKGLALPMPSPLPPEFRPAEDRESEVLIPGTATSDAGGSGLIDACCQLDGPAWANVMVWAATSS